MKDVDRPVDAVLHDRLLDVYGDRCVPATLGLTVPGERPQRSPVLRHSATGRRDPNVDNERRQVARVRLDDALAPREVHAASDGVDPLAEDAVDRGRKVYVRATGR